jgi:3D (Asp-Asp-Asp) domain-containing protein
MSNSFTSPPLSGSLPPRSTNQLSWKASKLGQHLYPSAYTAGQTFAVDATLYFPRAITNVKREGGLLDNSNQPLDMAREQLTQSYKEIKNLKANSAYQSMDNEARQKAEFMILAAHPISIACDPAIIHRGSMFDLPNGVPKEWQVYFAEQLGITVKEFNDTIKTLYFQCRDVGSAIKGTHIDIALSEVRSDSPIPNLTFTLRQLTQGNPRQRSTPGVIDLAQLQTQRTSAQRFIQQNPMPLFISTTKSTTLDR